MARRRRAPCSVRRPATRRPSARVVPWARSRRSSKKSGRRGWRRQILGGGPPGVVVGIQCQRPSLWYTTPTAPPGKRLQDARRWVAYALSLQMGEGSGGAGGARGGARMLADGWLVPYLCRRVAGARMLADCRLIPYLCRWVAGATMLADCRLIPYLCRWVAGARIPADCRHICLFSQMATWDVELAPGCDGGAAPKPPEPSGPQPRRRSLGEGDLVLSPTAPLRLKGAIIALAEPETLTTCWRSRGYC